MVKSVARKEFINKRKTLSEKEKLIADDLILIQFQKLSLPSISTVFSYLAMPQFNEIDTSYILNFLHFKNPALKVFYPVCDFSSYTMQAVLADDDTPFALNKFNTLEPENDTIIAPRDLDMILVPLLCFDEAGYRVGYGKGFYDKFLAQVKPAAIKIGLSYFEAIPKINDRNELDVPLDYCVTPQRIYEF